MTVNKVVSGNGPNNERDENKFPKAGGLVEGIAHKPTEYKVELNITERQFRAALSAGISRSLENEIPRYAFEIIDKAAENGVDPKVIAEFYSTVFDAFVENGKTSYALEVIDEAAKHGVKLRTTDE